LIVEELEDGKRGLENVDESWKIDTAKRPAAIRARRSFSDPFLLRCLKSFTSRARG